MLTFVQPRAQTACNYISCVVFVAVCTYFISLAVCLCARLYALLFQLVSRPSGAERFFVLPRPVICWLEPLQVAGGRQQCGIRLSARAISKARLLSVIIVGYS